jgi:hypothetical protein
MVEVRQCDAKEQVAREVDGDMNLSKSQRVLALLSGSCSCLLP